MSALLQQLDAWAAQPEPSSNAVLATLSDSSSTAAALNAPLAVIRHAQQRFDILSARLQRLVLRHSDDDTASLHRAAVDQRAVVAAGVWAYLRQAGLYLPDELQELAVAGRIDQPWHARESLRLIACLALLQPLLAMLERNTVNPDQFAARLRTECRALAAVNIRSAATGECDELPKSFSN